MKKISTLLLLLSVSVTRAQTITYSNFSMALNDTLAVTLIDNSSFSTSLTTTTGTGVTWNASGLVAVGGYPTIHFSFQNTAAAPHGSLFPSSNYTEYDAALTAYIGYNYYGWHADSLVSWGSYAADDEHEIFQDPDKRLIFPFSYSQSFTDHYAKTNYNDAGGVTSFQTGNRTVTFSGYGTLVLPYASFSNVGMIAEVRTNSLGPNSTYYTWYDLSNGKKLLYHSENDGSVATAMAAGESAGISEINAAAAVQIFPNPVSTSAVLSIHPSITLNQVTLSLYNSMGKEINVTPVNSHRMQIQRGNLPAGTCFYRLMKNGEAIAAGKIIVQ